MSGCGASPFAVMRKRRRTSTEGAGAGAGEGEGVVYGPATAPLPPTPPPSDTTKAAYFAPYVVDRGSAVSQNIALRLRGGRSQTQRRLVKRVDVEAKASAPYTQAIRAMHVREQDHALLEDQDCITACAFLRGAQRRTLAAATERGAVLLFQRDTSSGQLQDDAFVALPDCCFDLEQHSTRAELLAACWGRRCIVFDTTTNQQLETMGHSQSVKAITSSAQSPVDFATCARDGTACLWDLRVATRPNPATGVTSLPAIGIVNNNWKSLRSSSAHPTSMTAVLLRGGHDLVSGDQDGQLKLWDLRKTYSQRGVPTPVSVWGNPRQVGISSLSTDAQGSKLLVDCCNASAFLYTGIGTVTIPKVREFAVPKAPFNFLTKCVISPDASLVVLPYGEEETLIRATEAAGPLHHDWLATSPFAGGVYCAAWDPSDGMTLALCGAKAELWTPRPEIEASHTVRLDPCSPRFLSPPCPEYDATFGPRGH